jgi:hypothetical protein
MTCNSGLTPGLDCASGATNITYPAQGPGSIRPHAAISIAGQLQQYDDNGNLYRAGSRDYLFNAEN